MIGSLARGDASIEAFYCSAALHIVTGHILTIFDLFRVTIKQNEAYSSEIEPQLCYRSWPKMIISGPRLGLIDSTNSFTQTAL